MTQPPSEIRRSYGVIVLLSEGSTYSNTNTSFFLRNNDDSCRHQAGHAGHVVWQHGLQMAAPPVPAPLLINLHELKVCKSLALHSRRVNYTIVIGCDARFCTAVLYVFCG